MSTTAGCIYQQEKDGCCARGSETLAAARGQGDHVIPACLGEFRGDVRFGGICPACNSRIGQAEQQLVQSGPEGFFRGIVKPKSGRLSKRRTGRARGALGAPAPKHFLDMGDHSIQMESHGDDPLTGEPFDQLLVRDRQGGECRIRLHPGMVAEELLQAAMRAGLKDVDQVFVNCAECYEQDYLALACSAWPGGTLERRPSWEPGLHRDVPGHAKFEVNEHYFRALAKIGFHYYLTHSARGQKGDESHFAAIRRFILRGGDWRPFFDSDPARRFRGVFGRLPKGETVTPANWMHIVAAGDAGGRAVAYVRLFVGPGCPGSPYCVLLGRWQTRIQVPREAWGHMYVYDSPQRAGRYAGHVEPLQVMRLG